MVSSELVGSRSVMPILDECDSIIATLVTIIQTTRKNDAAKNKRSTREEH
jgi:hypothetical protein